MIKEKTERGNDACKSVRQIENDSSCMRQHDAFRVFGEYGCSQYCIVMYCHCLKIDLEIMYRVIYKYNYFIQDSDKNTHTEQRERMGQDVIWTMRTPFKSAHMQT